MKQRASQSQKTSPCPRASARSVLTGRRPRNRPVPTLHGHNKLRPSHHPSSTIRHREGRNSLRPHTPSHVTTRPHPRHAMYPRRLGAWHCGAASSLRPVNTEYTETRKHGGFQELGYTHLCNVPPDFAVLVKVRRGPKREGCACRVHLQTLRPRRSAALPCADPVHRCTPGGSRLSRPTGRGRRREYGHRRGTDATSASLPHDRSKPSGRAGARPSRVLSRYDNPIIFRPSSMGETARKSASKPISVSPCLRVLRVNRPEATRPIRATPPRSQQVAPLPLSVLVATLPPFRHWHIICCPRRTSSRVPDLPPWRSPPRCRGGPALRGLSARATAPAAPPFRRVSRPLQGSFRPPGTSPN